MIHAKTLGVLIAAITALMAFAGTASATQLTSPAGTTYTGTLNAASEGQTAFHTVITTFFCSGTVSSNVEQHGSATTVKGKVTSLSFTGCSYGITVKALKLGTVEIHPIAGTDNGTLTWDGAEIEIYFPMFGVKCFYSASNTHVGTLTASSVTGGTAVLDVASTLAKSGGSFLCPAQPGTWTGKYKFSAPDSLLVDA